MSEREDLRIVRSRKLIKDAFVDLIMQIDYESITIQDIAQHAEISRRTFYSHYSSKQELINEIINETIALLHIDLTEADHWTDFRNMIIQLFQRIKDHQKVFEALFHSAANCQFTQQVEDTFEMGMLNHVLAKNIKIEDLGIPIDFLKGVLCAYHIAVIKWWIGQNEYDAEGATEMLFRFLHFAIGHVEFQKEEYGCEDKQQ